MVRKLSRIELNALRTTTDSIYALVCRKLGYDKISLNGDYDYGKITKDELQEKLKEIDDEYCLALCKLETSLLEDLIAAHESRQIRRAPRTIDIVQKELLERVINEGQESNIT